MPALTFLFFMSLYYSCTYVSSPVALFQAENEAALAEVQRLQERLEASEHLAENLRRELRELGARQGLTHTELHQARMQVAQLTLQLSEENLVLREERANWALEREAYKHAAEVRIRPNTAHARLICQREFVVKCFVCVFSCRMIKGNFKNSAVRCRERRGGSKRRGWRGRN